MVTFRLMHYLLVWLVWSAAIWLTSRLLPGFQISSFGGAIVVALVFGLVNMLVGHLLYLVIGVTTLGLGFVFGFVTRWVVTAICLKITDVFSESLTIRSFGTAMLAALSIAFFGGLGEHLLTHGASF
jgi:putative membrane protein